MKFGHVLKILRTSINLTQGKMAIKLGISQNYLSLIEQGKKTPSNEILKTFALKLGVSEDGLKFLSADVPEELHGQDAADFQKLQNNVLSILIYQLTGEMEKIA